MVETVELGSTEEAKAYAAEHGGRFYVLAPETLAQIEAAEAAGGFEGGMSGASGEGGYSAEGSGAQTSSSASDAIRDIRSAWDPAEYDRKVGALLDGVVDMALGVRDFVEAIEKGSTGPVILLPQPELDKLLHGSSDDT